MVLFSKQYVTFEEAHSKLLDYHKHLNRNITPEGMVDRFYSNHKPALSLMPEMKRNLENRFENLPSDMVKTEM